MSDYNGSVRWARPPPSLISCHGTRRPRARKCAQKKGSPGARSDPGGLRWNRHSSYFPAGNHMFGILKARSRPLSVSLLDSGPCAGSVFIPQTGEPNVAPLCFSCPPPPPLFRQGESNPCGAELGPIQAASRIPVPPWSSRGRSRTLN